MCRTCLAGDCICMQGLLCSRHHCSGRTSTTVCSCCNWRVFVPVVISELARMLASSFVFILIGSEVLGRAIVPSAEERLSLGTDAEAAVQQFSSTIRKDPVGGERREEYRMTSLGTFQLTPSGLGSATLDPGGGDLGAGAP